MDRRPWPDHGYGASASHGVPALVSKSHLQKKLRKNGTRRNLKKNSAKIVRKSYKEVVTKNLRMTELKDVKRS